MSELVKELGKWSVLTYSGTYAQYQLLYDGTYVGLLHHKVMDREDIVLGCHLLDVAKRMRRRAPELEDPVELLRQLWPYKKPTFRSLLTKLLKLQVEGKLP